MQHTPVCAVDLAMLNLSAVPPALPCDDRTVIATLPQPLWSHPQGPRHHDDAAPFHCHHHHLPHQHQPHERFLAAAAATTAAANAATSTRATSEMVRVAVAGVPDVQVVVRRDAIAMPGASPAQQNHQNHHHSHASPSSSPDSVTTDADAPKATKLAQGDQLLCPYYYRTPKAAAQCPLGASCPHLHVDAYNATELHPHRLGAAEHPHQCTLDRRARATGAAKRPAADLPAPLPVEASLPFDISPGGDETDDGAAVELVPPSRLLVTDGILRLAARIRRASGHRRHTVPALRRCKHFAARGECVRGDSCAFAHVLPTAAAAAVDCTQTSLTPQAHCLPPPHQEHKFQQLANTATTATATTDGLSPIPSAGSSLPAPASLSPSPSSSQPGVANTASSSNTTTNNNSNNPLSSTIAMPQTTPPSLLSYTRFAAARLRDAGSALHHHGFSQSSGNDEAVALPQSRASAALLRMATSARASALSVEGVLAAADDDVASASWAGQLQAGPASVIADDATSTGVPLSASALIPRRAVGDVDGLVASSSPVGCTTPPQQRPYWRSPYAAVPVVSV